MLYTSGSTPQVISQVVGVSHAVPSGMPATDLAVKRAITQKALQMHYVSVCTAVLRHAEQMAGPSPVVKLHNRLPDCNSGHSVLERSPCAGRS